MGKLQICVSFKNTKEEQELYMYALGQTDKSIFIKNLIRQHINGRDVIIPDFVPPITKPQEVKPISHGQKTKSKFLS